MTTLGVNVGDEFIREGIVSFLDEILPSYRSFYVNKHDPRSLHETRLDEVAILEDKFRCAEIIVQSGAPVYWKLPTGSTCYNVDWAEELWFKRIFELGAEKVILNVGAGSCQPFRDTSKAVSADPQCAAFIRKVSDSCDWISVRDPLASEILTDLDLVHDTFPCPALHAARRFKDVPSQWGNVVGMNLMPMSGHMKLSDEVSGDSSAVFHEVLVSTLRQYHDLLFIAHDAKEFDYMRRFSRSGELIFCSSNYKDYFPVYAKCRGVFANRVHGAVCAAGFGRPAVIVGNDSRLRIAEYIGLFHRYIADAIPEEVIHALEEKLSDEEKERERLLSLRDQSARHYVARITEALQHKSG